MNNREAVYIEQLATESLNLKTKILFLLLSIKIITYHSVC